MPLIKFSNVSFHSMLKVAELPIVIAQKEEILVEYLCCVFGKKWDVLISREERNIFYFISSNRGCKQPSQQRTEVAPENRDQEYWKKCLRRNADFLKHWRYLQHILKDRGSYKEPEKCLLVKQCDPGLSPEMGVSHTGHCSPACAEDLVANLSAHPAGRLGTCAAGTACLVSCWSCASPSNCESLPGFLKSNQSVTRPRQKYC